MYVQAYSPDTDKQMYRWTFYSSLFLLHTNGLIQLFVHDDTRPMEIAASFEFSESILQICGKGAFGKQPRRVIDAQMQPLANVTINFRKCPDAPAVIEVNKFKIVNACGLEIHIKEGKQEHLLAYTRNGVLVSAERLGEESMIDSITVRGKV